MPERYHVRIAGDELGFSAAHFITLKQDLCERLHGHDYRVAAEVHGPLDENQYVVDFLALRDAVRAITDELDHRVLLPSNHPLIRVAPGDREIEVTFADRRWVFPVDDCRLLPVANTTAELMARFLAHRLVDELERRVGQRPRHVRIKLGESEGMSAVYEIDQA